MLWFAGALAPPENPLHHRQQAMAGDGFAEEEFVFELDAGHVEEVAGAFVHFQFVCEFRRVLVFDGVLTFQSSGEIHRHEPAGNVAGKAKRAPDRPEYFFAERSRPRVELFEPFPDASAMIPFFCFDLFYSFFLLRIAKALPMTSVRVRGCNLAGISVLQNADQIFAGGPQFKRIVTET